MKKNVVLLLSLLLSVTLLFTSCGKKEETVTAITNEQFTALYENAKTIYSETPELFAVNAEKPNIDLENVSDAEIPVSESMILKEAIQTIINENFSEELSNVTDDMLQNPDKGMDESFYKAYVVAKQQGLVTGSDTNYDEAITKAEAIDLILKAYEAIAKRDGYATNHQDGLNEGTLIDRGDQSTVGDTEFNGAVDINGNPIDINTDVVEGTTLTPAELDQLKANATTEWEKKNIEIYEQITAGGSWTGDNGGTYDKVVGIPGDTSWRKLTDAEAQAIVAKGEMNKETFLAECELEGASWTGFDGRTGTVYFDPYAYREAMDQVIPSENDSTFDGTETTKIEQQ